MEKLKQNATHMISFGSMLSRLGRKFLFGSSTDSTVGGIWEAAELVHPDVAFRVHPVSGSDPV
jgi:hypothetical protein